MRTHEHGTSTGINLGRAGRKSDGFDRQALSQAVSEAKLSVRETVTQSDSRQNWQSVRIDS